jgi:hypothetical protein
MKVILEEFFIPQGTKDGLPYARLNDMYSSKHAERYVSRLDVIIDGIEYHAQEIVSAQAFARWDAAFLIEMRGHARRKMREMILHAIEKKLFPDA